jgi:hypothetical protein
MVNWKGGKRKQPWNHLRWYPSKCLEGLRKPLNHDGWSGGRALNPVPSEYEADALRTHLQRSVSRFAFWH